MARETLSQHADWIAPKDTGQRRESDKPKTDADWRNFQDQILRERIAEKRKDGFFIPKAKEDAIVTDILAKMEDDKFRKTQESKAFEQSRKGGGDQSLNDLEEQSIRSMIDRLWLAYEKNIEGDRIDGKRMEHVLHDELGLAVAGTKEELATSSLHGIENNPDGGALAKLGDDQQQEGRAFRERVKNNPNSPSVKDNFDQWIGNFERKLEYLKGIQSREKEYLDQSVDVLPLDTVRVVKEDVWAKEKIVDQEATDQAKNERRANVKTALPALLELVALQLEGRRQKILEMVQLLPKDSVLRKGFEQRVSLTRPIIVEQTKRAA